MNEEPRISTVLLERAQPEIGVITLRRSKFNPLNIEIKKLIEAYLDELASDRSIRVVILRGSDTAFAAGTDLEEMRVMTAADHRRLGTNQLFVTMRRFPKPLIAAVEGFALGGGCELALNCDMIIAGRSARFGQPEI